MRTISAIFSLAASMLLVACGGGSDTCYGGPGSDICKAADGGAAVASIDLVSSAPQVDSAGGEVVVTAIVKDKANVALGGVPVTFSADSGALTNVASQTDAGGVATATLSAGSDKSNRTITVTVRAGSIASTIGLPVTASSGAAVASIDLLSSAPQVDSGGGQVIITAIVKDAGNVGLTDVPVSFVADSGALTDVETQTNASGVATAKLSAGSDKSNRTITVSVRAGSITSRLGLPVTASSAPTVAVSISTTTITTGAPATVTATVRNSSGVLQAGQVVKFSTNGGLGAFSANSALTNASGVATVTLSPASPSANGADLVVASVDIAGGSVTGSIGYQVNATTVPPVGAPSLSLGLSTTGVSTATPAIVTSVIKDAAGNPLPNAVVKFSTLDGLGAFNPPSALSDANGIVVVMLSPASSTRNGADLAVATTSVAGSLVTATAGFSVTSSGGPASGTPSITLTLSNSTVTSSTPANVTAVVKDTTGAGVAGLVVKFNTIDGLGKFTVNSALTDATGTASVVLSAIGAGVSGADQVVASTTVNGTFLQASQGFQLTVAAASIASFTADVGANPLAAYGQANLVVGISGTLPGTPVNVAVSSACVTKGKATLTPATVSTTTGTATFTYRDTGCGAVSTSDSLQASIIGTSTTRDLGIELTPPTVASITFTAATPQTIYLKGSGLTETSTVVFTVVDTAGNGVPNQSVTLEPTTLSGGLTLDGGSVPVTKMTDSLGRVAVLVNSGTVPTPVGVKATLNGATTVSSALSIAVGLPSELNFSLSQASLNIEGYDIDGTTNTYSIIASDRLANPAPTGTSINFIAEGGQIEPIKSTTLIGGLARTTANFVSASPRPLDGRITVLAYTLGEESFLDTNGNNIWDMPADTQFQDLGSVFLSRLFIDTYQPANDQLIPLAIPGVVTTTQCVSISSPLLALNVTMPSVGGKTCDGAWGRAYVRRATETVLSTSTARPIWNSTPGNLYANSALGCAIAQDNATNPGSPQNLIVGYNSSTGAAIRSTNAYTLLSDSTTLYGLPKSSAISFVVADNNPVRLNPVAAGSTITVTGTEGLTVKVEGGSPVPSSLSATFASMTITFADATIEGSISVRVTSPGGVSTNVGLKVSRNTAPGGATPCP